MTDSYPAVATDPGVTRQVLSQAPELMVVSFRFEEGAEGTRHSHPHIQATYVRAGRFEFYVGDETHRLAEGDSLVVPSGITHGCRCLEPGELIDTFAPRRDDFL
jgi:quercetin dioxygenase-like cupin family protein